MVRHPSFGSPMVRGLLVFVATTSLLACGGPTPTPPAQAPATANAAPATAADAGFGNHHHPIATNNPEAQRLFDRGFDFVFGFNHEEAAKAFARAAELDPNAAMPHWGVAWALGPNYNLDVDDARAVQANQAIGRALELSKNGPEAERAYIEAMAIRFSSDPKADRAALAAEYARRMAALVRRYPDDLDAATLYAESLMNLNAWKLWALDGTPAAGTEEIASLLESVLARDPDHLGANHYYIHTMEASPRAWQALGSADRLGRLAPAAGHLAHMPAHVYARMGDHDRAAQANRAGAEADRAYFKAAPADDTVYAMFYYSHNLHFLADSEMMLGRLAPAREATAELATRLAPHTQMMPMVESMITMDTSVLLRFARHADVIALPPPPSDHPVETAWWHFARGVALARTGKTADAANERTAMEAAAKSVPPDALFGGTGLESATAVLALAMHVLDARISWANGAHAESIALWRRAVAAADQVPYDEPPVWFYPVRESLGAALLLAGDATQAEKVFRDDLARFPRNARSLFGLHASLVRQGKTDDAVWVKRQFDEAWARADGPLTLEAL